MQKEVQIILNTAADEGFEGLARIAENCGANNTFHKIFNRQQRHDWLKELAGKKLVIIDDDQDFLRTIGDAATSLGVEVFLYDDPIEALSKAQRLQPDACLVDANMPQMSGLTIIGELRILFPRTG